MTRSVRSRAAVAVAVLAAAFCAIAAAPHAGHAIGAASPQGIQGTGKAVVISPDGIQGSGK